ncbi:DUF2779 domain-containing protein [Rhodospirillales bacterium]|nr:DUF2779 domain-containing protein [Rhodospirillales bacterium]
MHLTKSKYISGIKCERKLWYDVRDPIFKKSAPGSPAYIGTRVGVAAQSLFPGGVVVSEGPRQHREALKKTRAFLNDVSVPAIFEGAFEHDGVRIRVDILEKISDGRWNLIEVKSSKNESALLDKYGADAGVQLYVCRNSGLDVKNVKIMHVNGDYIYPGEEICWADFLKETDITQHCESIQEEIRENVLRFSRLIEDDFLPEAIPTKNRCTDCHYTCRCWEGLPDDWIQLLPNVNYLQVEELAAKGIHRMSELTDELSLKPLQERVKSVTMTGDPWVSKGLSSALKEFQPPVYYLDFETMNPAIPLFIGTKPHERVPFQYSLMFMDERFQLSIIDDFIARVGDDPRRPLAEALIKSIPDDDHPILAHSAVSVEAKIIEALADKYDDLAVKLLKIRDRVKDTQPLIKNHVYFKSFGGSFSIKTVSKELGGDFGYSYNKLEDVQIGTDASYAYWEMCDLGKEDPQKIENLIEYCRTDVGVLAGVHKRLFEISNKNEKN